MSAGIAILRPGTFTDIRGKTITFVRRDLESLVSSYDPQATPAPIVVGHPAENGPARGWIDRLSLDGEIVRAHPRNVAIGFAEAVRDGHYRKVSPQLYPPSSPANPRPGHWYLQHVGFLGGAAPAIKGLGTVALAGMERDSVVLAGELEPLVVGFAAPGGCRVDPAQALLVARARAIRAQSPGITFWAALTAARCEDATLAFAAPAGCRVDTDSAALARRARGHHARNPSLTYWQAFQQVRAELEIAS